jgi:hypothetical protein
MLDRRSAGSTSETRSAPHTWQSQEHRTYGAAPRTAARSGAHQFLHHFVADTNWSDEASLVSSFSKRIDTSSMHRSYKSDYGTHRGRGVAFYYRRAQITIVRLPQWALSGDLAKVHAPADVKQEELRDPLILLVAARRSPGQMGFAVAQRHGRAQRRAWTFAGRQSCGMVLSEPEHLCAAAQAKTQFREWARRRHGRQGAPGP